MQVPPIRLMHPDPNTTSTPVLNRVMELERRVRGYFGILNAIKPLEHPYQDIRRYDAGELF